MGRIGASWRSVGFDNVVLECPETRHLVVGKADKCCWAFKSKPGISAKFIMSKLIGQLIFLREWDRLSIIRK